MREKIIKLLNEGVSYSEIMKTVDCSSDDIVYYTKTAEEVKLRKKKRQALTRENHKKQLGESAPNARAKLIKVLMFDMVKKLELDTCFQCGEKIETIEEFSIEHKIPWLNAENARELFSDINNIAYSHLFCNKSAGRGPTKEVIKHPSMYAYYKGCRCEECLIVLKQKSKECELIRKIKKNINKLESLKESQND